MNGDADPLQLAAVQRQGDVQDVRSLYTEKVSLFLSAANAYVMDSHGRIRIGVPGHVLQLAKKHLDQFASEIDGSVSEWAQSVQRVEQSAWRVSENEESQEEIVRRYQQLRAEYLRLAQHVQGLALLAAEEQPPCTTSGTTLVTPAA